MKHRKKHKAPEPIAAEAKTRARVRYKSADEDAKPIGPVRTPVKGKGKKEMERSSKHIQETNFKETKQEQQNSKKENETDKNEIPSTCKQRNLRKTLKF